MLGDSGMMLGYSGMTLGDSGMTLGDSGMTLGYSWMTLGGSGTMPETREYKDHSYDVELESGFINALTPSSATPNGRTTQMACEWKGWTVVIADASRLGVSCSVLFGASFCSLALPAR